MTVAIIVLNYNRAPLTIRCLESLQLQEGDAWLVVIVDNGSPDGSAGVIDRWLRSSWTRGKVYSVSAPDGGGVSVSEPPGVVPAGDAIVLGLPANVGYGAGNNAGIRWALAHGCNDVWILNNDVVVNPSALSRLAAIAAVEGEGAVIGCTVLNANDRDRVECVGGGVYSWWLSRSVGVEANRRWAGGVRQVETLPDYVAGSAMYLTRGALHRVGLLREDLFLYFEEIDYAERCRKTSIPMVVCPGAVVWHEGGATTGSNRVYARRSPLSTYYSFRSAILVTATHRPRCLLLVVPARLLQAARFLFSGRVDLCRAAASGVRDGLVRSVRSPR